MCLGGGAASRTVPTPTPTSPTTAPTSSYWQWWRPPTIPQPIMRLRPDTPVGREMGSRRRGKRMLQIPLVGAEPTAGLGIPRTDRRE